MAEGMENSANINGGGAHDRLNNAVAVMVAIVAAFMAVTKGKDDNIVQAMLQERADEVGRRGPLVGVPVQAHQAARRGAGARPGAVDALDRAGAERGAVRRAVEALRGGDRALPGGRGRVAEEGARAGEAVRRLELPRRPVRPLRRGALGRAGDAGRHGADSQALAALGLAPVRGLRRRHGPRRTLRAAPAPGLADEAALLNLRAGAAHLFFAGFFISRSTSFSSGGRPSGKAKTW